MDGLQITAPLIQRIFPAYPHLTLHYSGIPVPPLPVSFQTILYLHNFNFKK